MIETVQRFSKFCLTGKKNGYTRPDKSGKKTIAAPAHQLSCPRSGRRNSVPAWVRAPWPFQRCLIQASKTHPVLKECFTEKETLNHDCREDVKWHKEGKILERKWAKLTSERQNGMSAFLGWFFENTIIYLFLLKQIDWPSLSPRSNTQDAPESRASVSTDMTQ